MVGCAMCVCVQLRAQPHITKLSIPGPTMAENSFYSLLTPGGGGGRGHSTHTCPMVVCGGVVWLHNSHRDWVLVHIPSCSKSPSGSRWELLFLSLLLGLLRWSFSFPSIDLTSLSSPFINCSSSSNLTKLLVDLTGSKVLFSVRKGPGLGWMHQQPSDAVCVGFYSTCRLPFMVGLLGRFPLLLFFEIRPRRRRPKI